MNSNDTLPKLLLKQYETWPNNIAMRKKNYGIWKEYSWRESYENVKYLTLCLIYLGMKRGEKVAIIGDNEPHWFWGQLAVQSAGGISVGIYTDMVPAQVKFIITHSEASYAIAKDQEQVDKFLEIKDEIPNLRKVIYWEPKGLRHYSDPILLSYNQAIEIGKTYEKQNPYLFIQSVQMGSGNDIAAYYYTSGTSGEPKAGMVSHKALISSGSAFLEFNPLSYEDNLFSYLPPAWIGEAWATAAHLKGPVILNFAEEPETIQDDMREIGPTVVSYGPRQWEDIARTIQVRINKSAYINRLLYNLCLKIGYKRAEFIEKNIKANFLWRFFIAVADFLVFHPLRENFGLKKCKMATTGSSAMSVDTFRFWRALGVDLKQIYGSTEAGLVSGHRSGEIYLETLGNIASGVEVKISEDQEILVRGPQIFSGYFKDDEKTKKTIIDGWVHTGDAGFIDKKGHLVFLDRLKDLGTLSNGTKFAPQYIEGRLRFSPFIKDAMCIGEKRDYISIIVIIDFANVGKWAEENQINYTTFIDLSQKEEIARLIGLEIRRVNEGFPDEFKVKKYALLHKEFDPDEEELTRTRKIRRNFMEERYRELVEAIYNDKSSVEIETVVKYQDGREAVLKNNIKIWSI